MAQSVLDKWAEDHARRAQEALATKLRLDGLQKMQDRIRDEMMADIDAEVLKEIEDEIIRTERLGSRS